jgi:hypothetical protein
MNGMRSSITGTDKSQHDPQCSISLGNGIKPTGAPRQGKGDRSAKLPGGSTAHNEGAEK